MAKSKIKKLTPAALNKLDSKLDEKKKIYIRCFDEDYEVVINLFFRKTTIALMITNYLVVLQDLRKRDNITIETLNKSAKLIQALIVKYFSDLPLPEINDIEDLVKTADSLIDLGIMDQLFGDNGFPKEQIEILNNEFKKFEKLIGENKAEMVLKMAMDELNKESLEDTVDADIHESQ